MKLYAYIEPSRFKAYLAEKNYVETEESHSLFLRDVGTPAIIFNKVKVGYVEVSPGSCVRLRTDPLAVAPVLVAESPLSFWSRKWKWCW